MGGEGRISGTLAGALIMSVLETGATQAGWEHSVPKVASHRGVRVSIQWRWTAKTGRPVEGASYRAPRHYSR